MEKLLFRIQDFEGPLDLLEHLIKKNKLDICTVSLIQITDQYVEYINQLQEMDLEISSDFLVMASELLLIKSKALLPKHEGEENPEDEAERLTEALRERRRMKLVSDKFRTMQYDGTYFFFKDPEKIPKEPEKKKIPSGSIDKLYNAFLTVLDKTERRAPPPRTNFDGIVGREPASVKEKAKGLITRLKKDKKVKFENIFAGARYKNEVVAIFLAVLELMKLNRIVVYDTDDSVMLELDANAPEMDAEEMLSGLEDDANVNGGNNEN
ncbi:MAG: segregation/condensation protein A [Clostridia bacterium]|nr:segregation/condensation protein A [Clostridia bacterium]